MKPEELDNELFVRGCVFCQRYGKIGDTQKQGRLDQRYDSIKHHSTGQTLLHSLSVASSPCGDHLSLEGGTHSEFEEHLKEPETPGESIGAELSVSISADQERDGPESADGSDRRLEGEPKAT